MSALPTLPAGFLYLLAAGDPVRGQRGLEVVQLDGGATAPWLPYREQREVWTAGERHRRRFITKSRRRGISTALDLEDAVWTKWCDELGHRVRTGVVLHREDNLKERMVQMASFLQQLYGDGEVEEYDADSFAIHFPSGSEIFGVTAGSKDAARSEGAQRMRYEEYAFYASGIGAIAPAVALNVTETICTTIDVGAPNGARARDMWRDETNGYAKIFFPFEQAREYRAPAEKITEEQWRWAQGEGFTIREAASFWLTEVLPNKCERDMIRAFREYPPTPDHMFRASETRWVNRTPRVLQPVDVWRVLGVGGDVWPILVYQRPADTSQRITITADAAKGAGVSKATVMAIDDDTGRVVACFADALVLGDDHARVAWEMYQRYTRDVDDPRSPTLRSTVRPRVLAEDNTTGQIFIQPARRLGLPVTAIQTTDVTQLLGMQTAKRAAEEGRLEGPKELAEECDECTRDPITGKFKGHKDLLMSYGFWAAHGRAAVAGPVDRRTRETKIDGRAIVRREMRSERLRRGF